VAITLVIAVTTCGCETIVAEEPRVRWALERIDVDVEAARRDADPTYHCAAIRQALAELKDNRKHHAVVARRDAQKVCRAALLAFAGKRTAAAVRPRRGVPPVAECVDLDRALALLADLPPEKPGPSDTEVAELDRRRKTLCQ
jgi:hypothetical protein